jgi:hypothetical protein
MGIRRRVANALSTAGFEASDWAVDEAAWNPGYRITGFGFRRIRVYHEGPDDAHFLDAYTGELRAGGFQVASVRSRRPARRWLRVTAPAGNGPVVRSTTATDMDGDLLRPGPARTERVAVRAR